ncbi:SDR family oxidoreductase [Methylobacterium pseudosasicola]|uniref:Short chain dehydrogenase n=1 Tax=Methylobacterium pseudosasicola TaxID=582667 RepID=A0A1I4V9J7_9HYPH|nr:SDR family NAD(P)-dependent oxidoreductase [Methylobacterium pseudosasicola]SFM97680.1 short chain dehydrogenase [Methylobacterium pseudosasicola]
MKTYLIIGAGPGIGLATAERFAREGFRVVLASRDADRTRTLAAGLRDKGLVAEERTVDASRDASVAGLVAEVAASFGLIDVLHYNAAALRNQTVADQPGETFNADLAVNIGGALSAVRAVAPAMAARGAGTILLTGGGFGLEPNPDFLSLSIGKAGIRALALGQFEPFRAQGVHIASVTVVAQIKPGSAEATAVGEHFWRLHAQAPDAWTPEATFAG